VKDIVAAKTSETVMLANLQRDVVNLFTTASSTISFPT
jgi:hypothetical protein